MKIRYKYSLISDVGNLRKNNEDNFFVFGEENRNQRITYIHVMVNL